MGTAALNNSVMVLSGVVGAIYYDIGTVLICRIRANSLGRIATSPMSLLLTSNALISSVLCRSRNGPCFRRDVLDHQACARSTRLLPRPRSHYCRSRGATGLEVPDVDVHGERLLPAVQGAEVGQIPVQADQPQQALDEAGRLPQRHSEKDLHR